jgi:leucine-rich repeat protein SHOC2
MSTSLFDRLLEHAADSKTSEFDFYHEGLTTLPNSIGNLAHLTKLSLSYNYLTSIPESIGSLSNLSKLDISHNRLTSLPEDIGNLYYLTELNLNHNQLTNLPESMGNLYYLTKLNLSYNRLTKLPDRIGSLSNLQELYLHNNNIISLPDRIGNLYDLIKLDLSHNNLTNLPDRIGDLYNLTKLNLSHNNLTKLPDRIGTLSNLRELDLNTNPLLDLSILQKSPKLHTVWYANTSLPRQYWTKFSEWKPEWLLVEKNAELRRILVQRIGYEKVCEELRPVTIDTWREYSLLKIDMQKPYRFSFDEFTQPQEREPIILLKMTCPSTPHIHILRVPLKMTSAEAAITWVNHGIHPDTFAAQT